jgi:hypothetical protein
VVEQIACALGAAAQGAPQTLVGIQRRRRARPKTYS